SVPTRRSSDLYLLDSLAVEGIACPREKAIAIAGLMQDRITFPREIWEQGKYFFRPPEAYDEKVASKKWNEEAVKVISAFSEALGKSSPTDAASIKATWQAVAEQQGVSPGKIMQALRLAVTGTAGGPDLMMIMEILGTEEVRSRIASALKALKVKVA